MPFDFNAIYTTIESTITDNWIDTPINLEFTGFNVNAPENKVYIDPNIILQKSTLKEISGKRSDIEGVLECHIVNDEKEEGTLVNLNHATNFVNLFNQKEYNGIRFFNGIVGEAREIDNKLYMTVTIDFEVEQGV